MRALKSVICKNIYIRMKVIIIHVVRSLCIKIFAETLINSLRDTTETKDLALPKIVVYANTPLQRFLRSGGITVYEERVSILGVDPQRFNTDLAYSGGVMAEIRSTMLVFRRRAKFGCGILKRGRFWPSKIANPLGEHSSRAR